MSNVNNPPHPRERLMIWHNGSNSYVHLVGNTCMYCEEKVDVLDPREYMLERQNGDSFNGYEAHHYLCAARAAYYYIPEDNQQQEEI